MEESNLMNELSKEILKGKIHDNSVVLIDSFPEKEGDNKLVFEVKQ